MTVEIFDDLDTLNVEQLTSVAVHMKTLPIVAILKFNEYFEADCKINHFLSSMVL